MLSLTTPLALVVYDVDGGLKVPARQQLLSHGITTVDTGSFADVDGIVVRSKTKVRREDLETASRLRIIGRAGVGTDNIDMDACHELGIAVVNTPKASTNAVCELTLGMLFSVARKIPHSDDLVREGKFEKVLGRELRGSRLDVIGSGRIGEAVSVAAEGLGMRVRTSKARGATPNNDADFVSLHTALSDETKYIVDGDFLAGLKKGAVLVNVARGGVVDEDAVCESLRSDHLGFYATDVFETEPPLPTNPLFSDEFEGRVLFTPHSGASTVEAQSNISDELAKELIGFFEKS